MFSQSAEFGPNPPRILPVVAYAGDSSMASKQTETVIEKIIADCDGNIHGALEALLLVNEYLEAELHRVYAATCLCGGDRFNTVH
jgi:hypothetical protein